MSPGLCCCQGHIKTSNLGAEPTVYIAHNQSSESPWFLARIQTKSIFNLFVANTIKGFKRTRLNS